jgi:hypothetical protein
LALSGSYVSVNPGRYADHLMNIGSAALGSGTSPIVDATRPTATAAKIPPLPHRPDTV